MKKKIYIGTDLTGLFKIGITRDEEKRKKQLRTGNPNFWFLFVFDDIENAEIEELNLHTMFHKQRIHGEWFSLSAEDLQFIANKFWGSNHELFSFQRIKQVINEKRTIKLKEFGITP